MPEVPGGLCGRGVGGRLGTTIQQAAAYYGGNTFFS